MQQLGRFLIAYDLLPLRIEFQSATQAVGGVGQVHQSGRDVTFLNRTMEIFGAPAANAIDEVRPMVAGCFAGRPGLDLIREPGLVGIVSIYCQITV